MTVDCDVERSSKGVQRFRTKGIKSELRTVNGGFEGSAAVISIDRTGVMFSRVAVSDLPRGAVFSRVASSYLSTGAMFSRVAFSVLSTGAVFSRVVFSDLSTGAVFSKAQATQCSQW